MNLIARCHIAVPMSLGKTPFAVQLNNKNNNKYLIRNMNTKVTLIWTQKFQYVKVVKAVWYMLSF
jgi:hypothetical protein